MKKTKTFSLLLGSVCSLLLSGCSNAGHYDVDANLIKPHEEPQPVEPVKPDLTKVSSVSFEKSLYKIKIGERVYIKASAFPETATNRNVSYGFENSTDVASIFGNAVTGLKEGIVKVVAVSEQVNTISGSALIQVVKSDSTDPDDPPVDDTEDVTIADSIMSKRGIGSTAEDLIDSTSKWQHIKESDSIVVKDTDGWRMTQQAYSDIDMTISVEGVSKQNPDGASNTPTKSFIIGGNVNPNEITSGYYGKYPFGYLINFSSGTNTINKGIQIYEWIDSKINSYSGMILIGRTVGNYEGSKVRVRIQGQTLSLFDEMGKLIYLDSGKNPDYHLTTLDLDHYYGGSIGVFSMTTNKNTEPSVSTFTISKFNGVKNETTNSADKFVNDLLKKKVGGNTLSNHWGKATNKLHGINTRNSYDELQDAGSLKFSIDSYKNFKLDFSIEGICSSNLKNGGSITKSILFGADYDGDLFTGYSLTPFNDGEGNKGITIQYHNNSLSGLKIGEITGDFDSTRIMAVVQNSYLRLYKNGIELCGGISWPERGKGLKLDNYQGGHIGILNWDEKESVFDFKYLIDMNENSNDDYSAQVPSKRVNLFIFAGQSNMEGNTRAWDNYSTTNYLRNYCESSSHNFDELTNGYEKTQISYHNNYVPNTQQYNYSNASDPMAGLFTSVKVGQGLHRDDAVNMSYIGPELGFAEKLNTSGVEEQTFIIKYASGGTSFGNANLNWRSSATLESQGYLYKNLLQFIYNNIKLIKEKGFVPIIKGIIWHQGESDGGSVAAANNYENYLSNFVYDLKNDLSSFAVDNKGENIAFIDAHINRDSDTLVAEPDIINSAKNKIASLSEKNFVLNTNSNGLDLVTGTKRYGGGDGWHYTVDSQIILGNAYADVVLNNHLLDF